MKGQWATLFATGSVCLALSNVWLCAFQIDGIVLNGAHFGYYHAGDVPSAINEAIVLHHQAQSHAMLPNQIPPQTGQPQQEVIKWD